MDLLDTGALARLHDSTGGADLARDISVDGADIHVTRFLSGRLTTAFEPVLALDEGRVAAAHASVRTVGSHGPGLAPWELFVHAAGPAELVRLDRLARTVHALNFAARRPRPRALHLSVHPRLVDAVPEHHGRFFRGVLDALRIDADRLVQFGSVDAALRAARGRGIDTIVDGVRSAFDAELARQAGATHVQGPLFGVPSAGADLDTPLAAREGALLPVAQRADVRRFLGHGFA